MHRNRSRDSQRKTTPSGPIYMSDSQMGKLQLGRECLHRVDGQFMYVANYLSDLRSSRQSRPLGSRPPPAMMNNRHYAASRASSTISSYAPSASGYRHAVPGSEGMRSASALGHRRAGSIASMSSAAGHPLAQDPQAQSMPPNSTRLVSPTHANSASPSARYHEIRYRQKERQEARSLRDALQEMDIQDEQRIYNSAQGEATELVWNHQHPGVPRRKAQSEFRNPDLGSMRSRYSSLYGRPARLNKASSVLGEGIGALPRRGGGGGGDSVTSKQRVDFMVPIEEPPTM